MASITQNVENQGFSLPLLEALDLHCFWARFYDQVLYDYRGHHFSDDTLCYFRQGEGWIRRDGTPPQAWRAPCLFLFRKTVAYSAQATATIQADSMHFRAELAGRPPVSLMDLLDVPVLLPTALTPTVGPILTAMSDEFRVKRLGSQMMLDGHLRILLAHFMRAWWPAESGGGEGGGGGGAAAAAETSKAPSPASSAAQPSPTSPAAPTAQPGARRGILRLAPALAWMAEHLAEPLSVGAMAAQVGLSTGHFTAFFKKTFRTTPAQYLIQLRIDRARRMLLTSDRTVNQIAHELGFSYPHYFIRQFKQSSGQTPAAWRAANMR